VLPVLFLLFVVMPIVELAVIIKVGAVLGVLNTIALLLLMGALGSWLVKREGIGVLRRVQRAIDEGRVPTAELVDGLLILIGGALLIAPGFISDVLGLSLMLPPVRAVLRSVLRRRLSLAAFNRGGAPGSTAGPDIIELP
jgi:UPF0716 protein FxsA